MRVIGIQRVGERATIDIDGCNLSCDFCAYKGSEPRQMDIIDVLSEVADPEIAIVRLGGMEPTLDADSLMDILERLSRMGKRVELKTNGCSPSTLTGTMGLVERYILEFNYPLDDPVGCSRSAGISIEEAEVYLDSVRESLVLLKDQHVTLWIRTIPGGMAQDDYDHLGGEMGGYVEEVVLQQYLSDTNVDSPIDGHDEPSPDESEMVNIGRSLLGSVSRVRILGRGFINDFRSSKG